MIISGGENVYPAEVEAVLHEHPAVAEAAVLARPDKQWGERVVAALVLKPDCTVDDGELKAFVRRYLAGYKCPREIRVVDSLPRNPGGKVIKQQLLEHFFSN